MLLAAVASLPLLFLLTLRQPHPSVAGLVITLLGIFWIGLALAHAVMLRQLPHGEGIVIDVLVGTFLGDTGAYLGGRLFGRRPLAPKISPGKTVEGLVAGMLCTVVAVWLAGRYQEWLPGTHALVLGLGVAVAGPLGDLFESFLKREAGVKDAGSCSARTAGRSTASTRFCSRLWWGITSGSRTFIDSLADGEVRVVGGVWWCFWCGVLTTVRGWCTVGFVMVIPSGWLAT